MMPQQGDHTQLADHGGIGDSFSFMCASTYAHTPKVTQALGHLLYVSDSLARGHHLNPEALA